MDIISAGGLKGVDSNSPQTVSLPQPLLLL